MAEYIEREATIELYCQKCKGYYDGHCIHRGECDVDVIQTAPAADVKPVKRGRWINDGDCLICSYCHTAYSSWFRGSNYCAECGADMRGEEQ